MLNLRPLQWPADRAALLALDTAFETNRIYRVVHAARSFSLEVVPVDPPLRKDYGLAAELDDLPGLDRVLVADLDGAIVGLAALKLERWNRRAVLWHCYVASGQRGRGVGRALIDAALDAAHTLGARCLWLETQTVNYPAIGFYERVGFRCCGLDTTLYDPATIAPNEIALFFVHDLPSLPVADH